MNRLLSSILYGLLFGGISLAVVLVIPPVLESNDIEVSKFFLLILFMIPIIVFYASTRSYYDRYTEPEKKLKLELSEITLSEKSLSSLSQSTPCAHCNGKGICDCDLCHNQGSGFKVGKHNIGDIRDLGLNRYNYSDIYHYSTYYKCSVCGGLGAIPFKQVVTINSDIEDIESMDTLQQSMISKLDKELELIRLNNELKQEEYIHEKEILDKELKVAEVNLEIQKERKNYITHFLEQLKNKIFSRSK